MLNIFSYDRVMYFFLLILALPIFAETHYEPNNTLESAISIYVNEPAQAHKFDYVGDSHWLVFYAQKEVLYNIEIESDSVAKTSDPALSMYDESGNVLVDFFNSNFAGEGELLTWIAPDNGLYYIKVSNDRGGSSENGYYKIKINTAYKSPQARPLRGGVNGNVLDQCTKKGLGRAELSVYTEEGALVDQEITVNNGDFFITFIPGIYRITVNLANYQSQTFVVEIVEILSSPLQVELLPNGGCLPELTSIPAEEPYRFDRLWPKLEQPLYFNNPEGITFGVQGNLYIADAYNNRIQVFSSNGEFIRSWQHEELEFPTAIAIDKNSLVYVASSQDSLLNNTILVFTAEGKYIHSWGGNGNQQGKFNGLSGISIDKNGIIYTAESVNNRIQVFTAKGEFIRSWGASGENNGELNKPSGLAIGANGFVYVADEGNQRIQVFSTTGKYLNQWGSGGTELNIGDEFALDLDDLFNEFDGQNVGDYFSTQLGITLDNKGNVYVADGKNHRIQIFTPTGKLIHNLTSIGNIGRGEALRHTGVAVSVEGLIYIVDTRKNQIRVSTIDDDIKSIWSSEGEKDGQFNHPSAIAVSDKGEIYVADSGNDRIQVFTSKGTYLRSWGKTGSDNGEFDSPSGISIDQNGLIYITDLFNARIQVFAENGRFIRSWSKETGFFSEGIEAPSGIAIHQNGLVYITDNTLHQVLVYTQQGELINSWGKKGSNTSEFNRPGGISISLAGLIYVTDMQNSRIQVFTEQGEYISSWGNKGDGQGEFQLPHAITVTQDDRVFVADSYNHRIQVFTLDGEFIEVIGEFGSSPGLFNNPRAVAVNSDGHLWVADFFNHRIQKFVRSGSTVTGPPHKAILLAGGGPSKGNYINHIWDATEILTNKAHQAIRSQGFQKNEVKYLTAGNVLSDLDRNGQIDDLEAASLNSLKQAITEWAVDAQDVMIYLIDHGGPGRFQVNDHEILTDEQLSKWVDQLDDSIPGKVTVIIESCRSGSFLNRLAKTQRNLISSADANQAAIISNKGLNSFSYYFWGEISSGATLQEAFRVGQQGMSAQFVEGRTQNAQLDSNGDEQFNTADYKELADYCLGNCAGYASNAPSILSMTEEKTLMGETSAQLSIQVNSLENIKQAWVTVIPPDFQHADSNEPVSELPKILLTCDLSQNCTTEYQGFDVVGDYQVTFYVQNEKYQLALPQSTTITQTQGRVVFVPQNSTARYDDKTRTVLIDDVLYGNSHYQAVLTHPPGDFTFSVKSAQELSGQLLQNPNRLDFASSSLILNKVSAFGRYFKVTLKHIGNFVFLLDTTEEITE